MEVLISLICLGRLCYTTKVLYRLYFCTISFCNFLQIKAHFYCFLYLCIYFLQCQWTLAEPGRHQILIESCAFHHYSVPWLVNDHAHQLLITSNYSGEGRLTKLFFIYSFNKYSWGAYSVPGIIQNTGDSKVAGSE